MIKLSHVNFIYTNGKGEAGLHDIDLHIKRGEVVLLCGASGCGKTSLTRLVNGLIPHYYEGTLSGTVCVDGQTVSDHALYELADTIGSVFQNPRTQFFNVDTQSELAFGCENLGMDKHEIMARVEKTTADLQLETLIGRSIFALSGGEKQKIACGCVHTLMADVVVLDEPSSNLDLQAIASLKAVILEWKKQGKTILISEHRLYYLKDIVDRVLYMQDGKIVTEFSQKVFFEQLSDSKRSALGLRGVFTDCWHPQLELLKDYSGKIYLKDFHYSYGKQIALHIPSLTLPMGACVAILGRNGAGKTTLSRCLCGLEKKCKGIMIAEDKTYKTKQRLSHFFMVMQDVNHQLFTESVLDEVLLSMPAEDESEAERILKSLDLLRWKDSHPMALSGGQKQRLAIACAVASQREFIVFDEPTSGLDYLHMLEVVDNIKALKAQGKSIFVVTHDMEFMQLCCDCAIHMSHGTAQISC